MAASSQNIYEESLKTFLKPIEKYMDDPDISEIMINGYKDIYIEKGGKLTKIESLFSERGVSTLAVNIAQFVGRQVGVDNPRLDARLPDGSRIHIVLPPIAKNGVVISIRKFFKEKLAVADLIRFGSFTPEMGRFIQATVELAKNMIISGGTGSGKTTMLNVLSNYIPSTQRIITMEDALELQLSNEHVVRFETRHPDKFGKGGVSMGDLLHSSLRLRPDRIILGEVRGGECFDLLQAMNTGHGGSMSTVHANNPIETLSRMESLVLLGGVELPLRAIRAQVVGAIQIIISTARYSDGSRRIGYISEVMPLNEKGDYVVNDIFIWTQTHKDKTGKLYGYSSPTGVLPSYFNKLKSSGYDDLNEDFFNPETYGHEVPPLFMGISHFTGVAEVFKPVEEREKLAKARKERAKLKNEAREAEEKEKSNDSPKDTSKDALHSVSEPNEKEKKIPTPPATGQAPLQGGELSKEETPKKPLTDDQKREILRRRKEAMIKKKRALLIKRKQEALAKEKASDKEEDWGEF